MAKRGKIVQTFYLSLDKIIVIIFHMGIIVWKKCNAKSEILSSIHPFSVLSLNGT